MLCAVFVGVVDDQLGAARDAGLADLPRDHGRVRRGAAAGGQDSLRDGHPVEVVRGRLDPDQDHLLAARDPLHRDVRVEDGAPDGGARRGVQALGDPPGDLAGDRVELVAQELVHLGRLDARDRLGLRDDAVVDHVAGDLHGSRGGPLRVAGLEHVEAAALDGELEVLDVPVVELQLVRDPLELRVRLGHLLGEVADLLRRPDPGHHVLALGVDEVLAVELLLAGVRVARERDAGPGVVTHVAEDHRDHVDGGPEVVGDLLAVAVVVGALAEPRSEDGLDGQVQLLVGVGGEVAARRVADDRLELGHELAKVGGRQVRVRRCAPRVLLGLDRVLEPLAVDIEDDAAEHLDEAPVGVPGEALVARQRHEAGERLLVEAKVEDRVHHARHRELRAGANGDQERVLRVPEALAGLLLHVAHRGEDVVPEAVGQPLAGGEVVVAGLRRDGESRRGRQAGVRHLGEPGALAAQEILHPAVALGPALAPGIDVALGGAMGARGRLRH